MQPIDRGDGAPKAGPDIWVRRLVASESIVFACASPAVWGVWIHWDGAARKSEPCFADHKKCPGHRRGLVRKWRGYLYGVNGSTRRYEFLEVTPRGSELLLGQCGDLDNMRGTRWTVTRGKGDTARTNFARLPDWESFTTAKLAEDIDPMKTLLKMWGFEDLDSGLGCSLAS